MADSALRPPRKLPVATIATLVGLIPLAIIGFDAATGNLGAEPVEALMRRTGWWAITILLVTLAITPLRRATRWNQAIQARRPLGLLAFSYALIHFTIYLVLDQWFAWDYIVEDLLERPLITAGFASLLLMIPLAATSTRRAIRKLGKRWQRLHRLIYPAAALGVLHYFWLIKADKTLPLLYAVLLAVLLALRIWNPFAARKASRASRSEAEPAGVPSP